MNRNILTALFTILSIAGYAQIKFDSGYFVTNDGNRTYCLIKNYDWNFNPTGFFYEKTAIAPVEKADIANVTEFGILNFSRYERYEVDVDTSAEQTGALDDNSGPEYKKKTVFLKVLVEGRATLYEYRDQTMTRFYFKTDSISLRPLVHKQYLAAIDQNAILENNLFRNQLISALQSPELNMGRFEHLKYSEASLIGIFDDYNRSHGTSGEKYVLKRNKGQFNFNLRLGADLSGLTLNENYALAPGKTTYGNKISGTVGLEAEDILPFNRNKWAIILQPTYHYYKADLGSSGSADYKQLQIGIGAREYFFIGKDSRLFATALAFVDEPVGSGELNYYSYSLNYRLRYTAGLSAGYKYKNKCSVELQYNLGNNILDSYLFIQAQLHTTSLIFAYTIF
jgi:hypothetical protein